MSRMTPERLAEIEGESVEFELVDALKAERKYAENMELDCQQAECENDNIETRYCELQRKHDLLEAALKLEKHQHIGTTSACQTNGKLCDQWKADCEQLQSRTEELKAKVRMLGNAHHNEIETRTKNTELQSRIEAVRKIADEMECEEWCGKSPTKYSDGRCPACKLREALGGSDE